MTEVSKTNDLSDGVTKGKIVSTLFSGNSSLDFSINSSTVGEEVLEFSDDVFGVLQDVDGFLENLNILFSTLASLDNLGNGFEGLAEGSNTGNNLSGLQGGDLLGSRFDLFNSHEGESDAGGERGDAQDGVQTIEETNGEETAINSRLGDGGNGADSEESENEGDLSHKRNLRFD